MKKIRVRLIDGWTQAWRFSSVQVALLLGFLATFEQYLPALAAYLPAGWMKWGALVVIVARVTLLQMNPEPRDGGG